MSISTFVGKRTTDFVHHTEKALIMRGRSCEAEVAVEHNLIRYEHARHTEKSILLADRYRIFDASDICIAFVAYVTYVPDA